MVCWPLRSSQNYGSGTTAFSLGGLGTYNGTLTDGPVWTADGLAFDGVNDKMQITQFIDARRLTIMSFVLGVSTAGVYDCYFGLTGAAAGNMLINVSSTGGRGLGVAQPGFNLVNAATSNGTGSYCVTYVGNASTLAFAARTIGGVNASIGGTLNNLSNVSSILTVGFSKDNSEVAGAFLQHTCSMPLVINGQLSDAQQNQIYTTYKETLGQGLGLP